MARTGLLAAALLMVGHAALAQAPALQPPALPTTPQAPAPQAPTPQAPTPPAAAPQAPAAPRPDPENIVPLPSVLEIAAPAANVPPDFARFHGAWFGLWGDLIRHVLIVERVAPDGHAQVVYAVGDSASAQSYRYWLRLDAHVEGNALVVAIPGATVSYRFDTTDSLIASYEAAGDGQLMQGLLRHLDVDRLALGTAAYDWPWPGERVMIPHLTERTADGARPILLEATVYRPRGTAPAPLAVINHGYAVGRDLLLSYSFLPQAHWLVAHGYAVVVPMRRGRGQSEGVYGESNYTYDRRGYVTDYAQSVAAAVADLDSAITYGNSLPFVRQGPVLLVGHSRGGMLVVHYAGLHPDRVRAVINFGGGWMGGPLTVLNMPLFMAAGTAARARVPQLWLYGEHDTFFAEDDIRAELQAFVRAGGRARIELVRGVPGDGHLLLNYPALWQPAAETFLSELPAPTP
jgi:dienelactone hydrolase